MSSNLIGKILALLLVAVSFFATVEATYCLGDSESGCVVEDCGCVHTTIMTSSVSIHPYFSTNGFVLTRPHLVLVWEPEPPVPPPNV
jgi:hypothetical protein